MRGGMRWPWLKRLLGPWPCKRSASSSVLFESEALAGDGEGQTGTIFVLVIVLAAAAEADQLCDVAAVVV